MSLSDLFQTPAAVDRLGEDLFLKLPLWRASIPHNPVYINRELFEALFGSEASSWEEMAETLAAFFSVTLAADASIGVQTGWAYVDRQFDPLHISLAGNEGSGRAYYAGKYFNIKGEKTPLAISPRKRFSDGLLEMERGIWEAMAANVLHHDCEVGVAPVLAVFDMQEMCNVEWRSEPVKRAKIIRVDYDGALDRVTHVFFNKTAFSEQELLHTANRFGRQGAEKFIERIIHGAWSPGNISMEGHLMDFDTVCAVKGRGPVHSSSMWHVENYFGYESLGQQIILDSLADDQQVNPDNISKSALQAAFTRSMQVHTARRFLYLMGFEHADEIMSMYAVDINELAQEFGELAYKFYPKMRGLSAKTGLSNLIHVFDFSFFFRLYPIVARMRQCDAERMVGLMIKTDLLENPFQPDSLDEFSEKDQLFLQNSIYAHIEQRSVTSQEMLDALCKRAHHFVTHYDALFRRIAEHFNYAAHELEARAYVINEDRFYLLPPFTPSYNLAQNKAGITNKKLNEQIEIIVDACKRKPVQREDGSYWCDLRLFREGVYYILLDRDGFHRHCFSFFTDECPQTDNFFRMVVDGQEMEITVHKNEQSIDLIGNNISNVLLLASAFRDRPLMFSDILIYTGDKSVILTDFLESE